MSFPCSRIPPSILSPFHYRILLVLTVSLTGLSLGDSDRLEGADRVCHGVSLRWCWSCVFLMVTPGYEFGAGRPGERPWRHVAPRCFRVALMLARQRSSGVPCDILSPLPRTVRLERQRLQSPLNGWGRFEDKVPPYGIWTPLHWRSVCPPQLFIYSTIYL